MKDKYVCERFEDAGGLEKYLNHLLEKSRPGFEPVLIKLVPFGINNNQLIAVFKVFA